MTEFAVHVTTDRDNVTGAQLDKLETALAPVRGMPGMYCLKLTVQATADSETFGQAIDVVTTAVLEALRAAGLPSTVEKVEARTQADFDEFGGRLLDPLPDPTLGPKLRKLNAAIRDAQQHRDDGP